MKNFVRAGALFAALMTPFVSQADPQVDRMSFIQRLTDKGIFLSTSIEDGVPKLVVTPEFYESDLESKRTAVGVVYQYYVEIDSTYHTLRVIEGSTGAEIGTFTAEGLQL